MKIEQIVTVDPQPDLDPARPSTPRNSFQAKDYALTLDPQLRVVRVSRTGSSRSFIVALERCTRVEFSETEKGGKK
jgi:hypothetical protein